MIVRSLQLKNFRNYETLDISLDQNSNLFFGDNAQGKTNILESIFLCGTTRSHRQGRDSEMIMFGQEEAHIRMEVTRHELPCRIDMHLKKNRAKGIAINGVPIHRASELIGMGTYVFFSPEDLGMIKNGPAQRRRFIDMQLCQISREYVHNLSSYSRVLMQRNKLLKDISYHPDYLSTLDVWDQQLADYGCRIISQRKAFIRMLAGYTGPVYEKLTGGKEKLGIVYEPDVQEEDFLQQLHQNREKDIKYKMTGAGPHRDDLLLQSNGMDLRRYGSQGQQRTAALSLKLGQIELARQVTEDTPVLLLDDVLSELDRNRQQFLLESIENIQTMITCTGVEDYVHSSLRVGKVFHVSSQEGKGSAAEYNPQAVPENPVKSVFSENTPDGKEESALLCSVRSNKV